MTTPSLLGIPPETRLDILRELFRGVFFGPGHDKFCKSPIHHEGLELSACCAVLAVNRLIRNESLPILAQNLSIFLRQRRILSSLDPREEKLPGFCHNVSILYMSIGTHWFPRLRGLQSTFPNLKRVEYFLGIPNSHFTYPAGMAAVVSILTGGDDEEVLASIKWDWGVVAEQLIGPEDRWIDFSEYMAECPVEILFHSTPIIYFVQADGVFDCGIASTSVTPSCISIY